jgi:hypothetical protein
LAPNEEEKPKSQRIRSMSESTFHQLVESERKANSDAQALALGLKQTNDDCNYSVGEKPKKKKDKEKREKKSKSGKKERKEKKRRDSVDDGNGVQGGDEEDDDKPQDSPISPHSKRKRKSNKSKRNALAEDLKSSTDSTSSSSSASASAVSSPRNSASLTPASSDSVAVLEGDRILIYSEDVGKLNPGKGTLGRRVLQRASRMMPMVRVAHPHKAQDEQELTLTAGDMIIVRGTPAGGWCEGQTIKGEVGWFPISCTPQLVSPEVPVEVGRFTQI